MPVVSEIDKELAVSFGGSVFVKSPTVEDYLEAAEALKRGEEMIVGGVNWGLVHAFVGLCQELCESDFTVAVIVGGGDAARKHIKDVKENAGGEKEIPVDQLDHVGIALTKANAAELLASLINRDVCAKHYSRTIEELDEGFVYVRGGTEPGHTTDFVAVQAAIHLGTNVVINISKRPGLHPGGPENFNISKIVKEQSLSGYISDFDQEHVAGVEVPFDPEAAKLAKENNITVVLVGPDVENVRKVIDGEEFTGTVLTPE
jgi:uridylate kinase